MRKKVNSIIFTILTVTIGALPHAPKIVPGGMLLTTAAVAVVLSSPPKCAASIAPAIHTIVAIFQPPACEASVMERLCSHVTSFLGDEADRASTDLKNCKKNCNWKKHKNDLLISAKKKAKDSCARGEAPNINDINKGLDPNAKTRLKDIYNRNSQLFDGAAKLPVKDFAPIPSKQAALLTGKGGQVTDLKSAEPAIPKLNAVSVFSLSGTKLSGDMYAPSTTKQSAALQATAAQSSKASADITSASPVKSLAAAESDNTSGTPQGDETISQEEVCAQIAQAIKDVDAGWEKAQESDAKTRLMCGQWPPEVAQVCYASADETKAAALQKFEKAIQGLEKTSYEAGCGRCCMRSANPAGVLAQTGQRSRAIRSLFSANPVSPDPACLG